MTPAAVVERPSRPAHRPVTGDHSIRRLRRDSRRTKTRAPSLWTGAVAPLASAGAIDEGTLEIVRNAARDRLCITREPGWLAAFVQRAWGIIDPKPLVWNWHLTLICAELERVAAGLTRELVISVPPGTAKSMVVSALFPAALWLREPETRVLAIANVPRLVTRDAVRHRDVILSAWYRGLVRRIAEEEGIGLVDDGEGGRVPWTLKGDVNAKTNFDNTAGGGRQVGSVGGSIIGERPRGLLTDDCYDAKEATDGTPAQVAERMAYVVDQYDSNWKNRIDPLNGWRVSIMQGLAEGDLADVLVRRGVRRVILPMEFDPEAKITVTPPGGVAREEYLRHPRDPRKVKGELLFPARFSREWCEEFKGTAAGARIWGPQYQQRRASLGGKLFPRIWYAIPATRGVGAQRYSGPPAQIAKGLDNIAITVDCTFGDSKGSDNVAIHAWGYKDANRFLLDRVADQMTIGGTIASVIGMRARWNAIKPGGALVRFVLFERKANGQAVIDLFEGQVPSVIGYVPATSKYGRAQISSYKYQAGNLWLPMPEHAPWVHEFVEFHVNFTGAAGGADDDIDAESQLMIHLDDADAQQHGDPMAKMQAALGGLARRR